MTPDCRLPTKIKICGLTDPKNVREVLELAPDYIGFIFYPASKRYIDPNKVLWVTEIQGTKKTGVFVNASADDIRNIAVLLNLDAIQLHGNESPTLCKELKQLNIEIIKAIGVAENFNWNTLENYADTVDYFLFDTASAQYGGTGAPFNWNLLKHYSLHIPYFLSGGIGPENLSEALGYKDERLYAIDLNSRFESGPGIKNTDLLKQAFALTNHKK